MTNASRTAVEQGHRVLVERHDPHP